MSFISPPTLSKLKEQYNYRDTTLKTIDSNIRRVFRNALGSTTFDSTLLLSNQPMITKYLESIDNTGVRKAITNNLLALIRIIDPTQIEYYTSMFDSFAKIHEYEYKGRLIDDGKFVPLEVLYKRYNSLPINNYRAARNKVVAGFYSGIIPSLRGQDYYTTRWGHLPKDTNYQQFFDKTGLNYLDLTNMILILGNYKTSNRYKLRLIVIPTILHGTLKTWRKFNEGDFLLTDNKYQPYTEAYQFSRLLDTINGNSVTVDTMRQIYITEMTDYIDSLQLFSRQDKIRLKNKLATLMAHSPETQQQIYAGYKDNKTIERSSPAFLQKSLEWFLESSKFI